MKGHFLSLLPYWVAILGLFIFLKSRSKDLAKDILWASFRTTIQLLLLALALEAIFQFKFLIVSLLASLVMTFNSALQIKKRSNSKYKELLWDSFLANVLTIWPVGFCFSLEQSGMKWGEPEFFLPLIGMLLGNSLSGVSIGVNSFLTTAREGRDEILTLLALGATDKEATRKSFFRGVRAGIAPLINSMISMGIVSIPGLMAGQIIAQESAMIAAIFQIKLMICLSFGTILCTYLSLRFARKKLFLSTGELCFE